VGEIDSYLDESRSSIQGGDPLTPEVIEWVDWIAAYCDGIDPLKHPPVMPETSDPSPEDLRPFLKAGILTGQTHAGDGLSGRDAHHPE
jgi:hypothetical protein